MNELIEKIVNIIGDYREHDINFSYQTRINKDHVTKWINQFEEEDREFILSELLHLLPNSYLTKTNTLRILSQEFEIFKNDFGYDSIDQFLDETKFLDCQKPNKSQKVLLQYVDEILQSEFKRSLADCGTKKIKNWIYFDDVLASGGTFRTDIFKEIDNYGQEDFKKSEIRIIASFVILHTWATKNIRFAFDQKLKDEIGERLKFYRVSEVDNNPYINKFYHSDPKFNHIYPIESELGKEVLEFVENAFNREYDMGNEKNAFRSPKYPKSEEFFSSPDNRIRYENILLKKGYDIMKSIENLRAQSLRPLGMTPPSYKTLGTGSHFFTWRNISNTCPIIFWWGANDWFPLFPVKNRGR